LQEGGQPAHRVALVPAMYSGVSRSTKRKRATLLLISVPYASAPCGVRKHSAIANTSASGTAPQPLTRRWLVAPPPAPERPATPATLLLPISFHWKLQLQLLLLLLVLLLQPRLLLAAALRLLLASPLDQPPLLPVQAHVLSA
jgi:hypothetical protein